MIFAARCNAVLHPRRNRVTPFGEIEATPHKGTMMGNRGDLHAGDGRVARTWRHRSWISCVTTAIDGPVAFDTPGRYTPLFFFDEPVALAAGHRPCGRCRAEALKLFRSCWKCTHGVDQNRTVSVEAIDNELHAMRLGPSGKITYKACVGDLPKGVFVAIATGAHAEHRPPPILLWGGKAYPWTHAGYSDPVRVSAETIAEVLTPRPIVDVLKAGYSELLLPKLRLGGA